MNNIQRIPFAVKQIGSLKDNSKSSKIGQRCNCKRSNCLKLYCECFSNGFHCTLNKCNCIPCLNNSENEDRRRETIEAIMERNPFAFRSKVALSSKDVESSKLQKGCHCKKSNCLKKYCECFQVGTVCSEKCRCTGCKNFPGSSARTYAAEAESKTSEIMRSSRTYTTESMLDARRVELLGGSGGNDKRTSARPVAATEGSLDRGGRGREKLQKRPLDPNLAKVTLGSILIQEDKCVEKICDTLLALTKGNYEDDICRKRSKALNGQAIDASAVTESLSSDGRRRSFPSLPPEQLSEHNITSQAQASSVSDAPQRLSPQETVAFARKRKAVCVNILRSFNDTLQRRIYEAVTGTETASNEANANANAPAQTVISRLESYVATAHKAHIERKSLPLSPFHALHSEPIPPHPHASMMSSTPAYPWHSGSSNRLETTSPLTVWTSQIQNRGFSAIPSPLPLMTKAPTTNNSEGKTADSSGPSKVFNASSALESFRLQETRRPLNISHNTSLGNNRSRNVDSPPPMMLLSNPSEITSNRGTI